MQTLEIEKNVPIPNKSKGLAWPWNKMDVGDSVFIEGGLLPGKNVPSDNPIHKAQQSALAWGSRHGKKFKTRRDGSGLRVWRIA